MPGIELASLVKLEVSHDLPLLKAHKALPKRRDQLSITHQSPPTHKPRVQSLHDKYTSTSIGNTATLTPPPSRSDADLPLTPPSNHRLTNGRTRLRTSPAGTGTKEHESYNLHQSGLSTPLNQQSPPTPDSTPPKPSVKAVAWQAQPKQRDPSSRAESFRTARENQSSSDEDSRRQEQSSQTARQKWLDATRSSRLKDIGLGLGLESEDEQTTPTMGSPIKADNHGDFIAFNGAWDGKASGSHDSEDYIREWDSNLMRNVTVRKLSHKRPRVATQPSRDKHKLPENQDTTHELGRGPSLRERIEKRRNSPTSASTEKFGREIEWPSTVENLDFDMESSNAELRRLSGMSGTSTIVEAMVVDAVPQRRQTLRHTGRNLAFRRRTLMYDPPDECSTASDERQHRLVHKDSRIPIRGHSMRVASDASVSIRSMASTGRKESIPVNFSPVWRSSLDSSSAPSSKYYSGSQSLTSTYQQSRPTTAPDGGAGYFDIPLRRRRPLSESISSVAAESSGRTRNFRPIIPQRSSSLSAPTSRDVSRSTSLTSASPQSRKAPKRNVVAIHRRAISQLTTPDRTGGSAEPRITSGWSHLKPPASQITPFSQPSITSSSPEAHEVSEATAVTIFPHNNESLLVVQQRARPILEIPKHLLASSEQSPDIEEPPTPPPLLGYPGPLVESPLKNPRKPPEPPMFKIIPPTPANNTPTNETERPSMAVKTRPGGGTLSLVRRALSARRYSESFISPFSRLPGLKSPKDQIPTVNTEKDSKLHPFWRPRGFWDDFSDSDSDEDFGNEGQLLDDYDQRMPSNTSTSDRRTSMTLPLRSLSQTRRPPQTESESDSDSGNEHFLISKALNTVRSPKASVRSKPKPTVNTPQRRFSFPLRLHAQDRSIQRKQSSGSMRVEKATQKKNNKGHGFPSVQVEFIGLGGLQERLRLKRERKEEERREKERARLRKSIGARIVMPDARVV
ncbi:MAG: hypothetical protein M1836_006799 [Candelina mexicana]|nr:MAG: hypothetical protein M1836_006799 [Candelina mexicana]